MSKKHVITIYLPTIPVLDVRFFMVFNKPTRIRVDGDLIGAIY